jgi:DNA polymerase-3 subunit epsilon
MGLINKDVFICLDCETTGLEIDKDRIIEIALVRFNFDEVLDSYETLIDPQMPIPEASTAIHHITDPMVKGQPKIQDILPQILAFIKQDIIVGHGITTDIAFICSAAKHHSIPCKLAAHPYLDTLRMARLYGESPINSLEVLRRHFNIAEEGAHRAMNDVVVNIEVFKYLCKRFKTTEQVVNRLKSPIQLRTMPLGKHKGRPFSAIPVEYLRWAVNQKFDQDLMFSLKTELKKRNKGANFGQAANPFANL